MTFNAGSQGELAAVIYEWADVQYLGKDMSQPGELPVRALELLKSYYLYTLT